MSEESYNPYNVVLSSFFVPLAFMFSTGGIYDDPVYDTLVDLADPVLGPIPTYAICLVVGMLSSVGDDLVGLLLAVLVYFTIPENHPPEHKVYVVGNLLFCLYI